MKELEKSINKICSFYVNQWHLATMTLPHINETINKGTKIITLLQKGIENNIYELISKMNLKTETKDKILAINWTSNPIPKYTNVEKDIIKALKTNSKIEIIINGNNQYIESINQNINKTLNKNQKKIKDKQINIINCYEIAQFDNITNILDQHSLILNTSGINSINQVFTGYEKQAINQ